MTEVARPVLRRPWVTYGIIAANLFAFVLEVASGASAVNPTSQDLFELGANFAPRTLHGEPWRLLSSMFLHAGLLHIGMNLLGLWQGRVVELIFGRAGFLAIYLGAGLLGGVACLVASPDGIVVGASGAVFGVFGAFGAFLLLRRTTMPEAVWQATVRQMIVFLGINLVFGFTAAGISMASHVGGLAAGFGLGAALLAGASADRQRPARALALVVASVAITAGALVVIRAPVDVGPALAKLDRVETAAIGSYQALMEKSKDGALTDAQVADEIEREVLAPWKAVRAELVAVGEPLARQKPLYELVLAYAASREAVWEASAAVLRATGDARPRAMADFQVKEQALAADMERLQTHIATLKK